jgi:hypothetical protein
MHKLGILGRQRLILLEPLVFHLNEVANLFRQLGPLVHKILNLRAHALLQFLKGLGKVLEDARFHRCQVQRFRVVLRSAKMLGHDFQFAHDQLALSVQECHRVPLSIELIVDGLDFARSLQLVLERKLLGLKLSNMMLCSS